MSWKACQNAQTGAYRYYNMNIALLAAALRQVTLGWQPQNSIILHTCSKMVNESMTWLVLSITPSLQQPTKLPFESHAPWCRQDKAEEQEASLSNELEGAFNAQEAIRMRRWHQYGLASVGMSCLLNLPWKAEMVYLHSQTCSALLV